MKIRKFFSFVVVTILLSLSVSVISSALQLGTIVNSQLSEPEPVDQGVVHTLYVVVQYDNDPITYLDEFTFITKNPNDEYGVAAYGWYGGMLPYSVNEFAFTLTQFNAIDGTLIAQNSYSASDSTLQTSNYYGGYINGKYISTRAQYLTSTNSSLDRPCKAFYFIKSDNATIPNVPYQSYWVLSDPFVEWSVKPPEHNVYHSQLSEPVADEYNSYFVCNDKLYWISYRVNGLYSFQYSIEVESQTYIQNELYSGSGSGSYAGSNNGYTESFSLSGQEGGAVQAGSTPSGYLGAWQSDPAQIDYVGVSQGSINTNHSGMVTYNNVQVYPVAYNGEMINRFFNVCAYVEDNKSFYLRIYPNNDQMMSLIVDMDIYTSEFNLTDGSYISSTFNTYQGSVLYAGEHIQLSDEIISDVRCYGLQFRNVTNIPVNLSDVIWEYDLEFVQWQQSMFQVLQQIYNLINNSSGETESVTLQDFAGELQSAEQNYSNLNAQDFNVMLGEALPAGKYDNAASQIKQWISDFSIGELIAVAVFALALGTVTLTLGKKKSD